MKKETMNVLLIEDNPHDVELLRVAVERSLLPMNILVLSDGALAVHYITVGREQNGSSIPDIVLLDMNVPKRNGLEVLEVLKANPPMSVVPVIMLSTSNSNRDIEECYSRGAASYIVKPQEYPRLVDFVKRLYAFWRFVEIAGVDGART